ncbi:MAG: conjugal transfer protein TraX [Candidatus Nealsonbacteria bacterium]|nr:conjugal transfer protein TraX [Candidatus Nealsonbacteria bacterium]
MITKGQSNFIKLIAIISMLLDHIGAFLFPLTALRIIGRIALPIFAYQLGIGYRMTSDRKEYVKRILLFGLISQIPFFLLNEGFKLNILFSLALGIFLIWAIEEKKYLYVYLIAPLSFFVEYQIYGLVLISIFYFFKNKNHQFLLISAASFASAFYYQTPIQLFAILSLPIIFKPSFEINIPRNLFYFFYPTHLLLIYLIKIVFFK